MESEMQKIVDRILRDAKEKAESILADARKSQIKKIEAQRELALKGSEVEVTSILNKGEEEAMEVRRTVVTDAKRRAGWIVLSEKERQITSVINEVMSRFKALSSSERYIPILQKLIVEAGITLSGGKLEILLSEQDSKIALNINTLTKAIAVKTGNAVELKISSKRIKSFGGCVIRTQDKKIVIDNTFSAILKRRERELRFKITKILFRE
jgi:vacuolar-type H+-ATPase subunit E/Vma4